MRLQVEAFTGRVRRNKDAHRVSGRVRVKGPLDLLPLRRGRRPVVDRDAVLRTVAAGNGRPQLSGQVAFGVGIFRKDDHSSVLPRGPALAQGRAQVLADPGEEATDACIWQVTARLRHLGHGVEKVLFARKQGLGRRIGQRPEGRR